jgi:predicted nucleic acid-binding protein
MTLLDSNIVIYAAKPERADLRQWIAGRVPAVSAVTVVEALGYHKLAKAERVHLEAFFAAASVLPISELVVQQAVALRQSRRMSLGDSLIGATALVHRLELATRNVKDLDWIAGLTVIDPLAEFDIGS